MKIFDLGAWKDFVELIIMDSEGKVVRTCVPIRSRITFSKGDAMTITGAKAKRDEGT